MLLAWDGGIDAALDLARRRARGEAVVLRLPPPTRWVPDFLQEALAERLDVPWTREGDAVAPARPGDAADRARGFVWQGHRAVVASAPGPAGRRVVGRVLDPALLVDLEAAFPPGSWHALLFDGPLLGRRVDLVAGEPEEADGRWHAPLGLGGC